MGCLSEWWLYSHLQWFNQAQNQRERERRRERERERGRQTVRERNTQRETKKLFWSGGGIHTYEDCGCLRAGTSLCHFMATQVLFT